MKEEENKLKTPFELFDVECGKGWYPLIEPIFNYIEEYNKDKKEEDKIEILQVKEKFGGLRFYTNFYTDDLRKLIREAESKSYTTCELCGTTDNIGYTSGYILTICEDCHKKQMSHLKWKRKHDNA